MEEGRGLDNRDAPVRPQCEQVLIAGHDVFGATGECGGKHVVVVGVTRNRGDLGWFDKLTEGLQRNSHSTGGGRLKFEYFNETADELVEQRRTGYQLDAPAQRVFEQSTRSSPR